MAQGAERVAPPAIRVQSAEASTSGKTYLSHIAVGVTAAGLIALVFYTSFFRYPSGLMESVRALGGYVERGVGAGPHVQPWDYYLRLLAWSASGGLIWTEGVVLALALMGMIHAVRQQTTGFWPRFIGLYALLTLVAFSVIRYKTPWNLLPFYIGFVLMAGVGAASLIEGSRSSVRRALVVVVLLAASWQLGVQDWRANGPYASDPRNPYVYAHTTPDFLRLVRRVTDVAALHAERDRMLVKVIAGPYEQWPLPWYLRRMTRVGYWTRAADAGPLDGVPVIIAAQDSADALDAALGDRYVSEFYGLRPDVLLRVYIERSLWERFIASRL
jgi:predicted membrane-bound mannosyltransferase